MLRRCIFVASSLRLVAVLICTMAILGASANAALAAPEYRGAQVHSLWSSVSSSQMTQELNDLQSAGVNVLRVDVAWRVIEWAGKGQYDPIQLSRLDTLVNEASTRGMKVIATLACTPPWASAGKEWYDAPSNPADYGDFARFVTARYGTKLAAVEAWNEPEINNNLVAENLPLTYTAMVKQLYRGAREGNSSVAVLAGALSYPDITFMNELYADGIAGYYDGVSLHPYADQAAPENTSVTHSFKRGIEEMHADQLSHGDNTPEWVTEFGWFTGTSTGAVTEQLQAEYTEKAFGVLNGFSYVKGATLYQLRDMAVSLSDPEDNFGLLHNDFTPRPAYAALKSAMLAASSSQLTQTTSEPSSSITTTSTTTTTTTETTTTSTGGRTSKGSKETSGGKTRTAKTSSVKLARRTTHRRSKAALFLSRKRVVIVRGAAPRRSKVIVRVLRSVSGQLSLVRRLTVHASRRGRYRLAVGRMRQLKGCRIVVQIQGQRGARVLRVRY
jgi:polysaccharide biosynthesis protein PslG